MNRRGFLKSVVKVIGGLMVVPGASKAESTEAVKKVEPIVHEFRGSKVWELLIKLHPGKIATSKEIIDTNDKDRNAPMHFFDIGENTYVT